MPPASIAFFTSAIVVSAVRVSAVVVIDMLCPLSPIEGFELLSHPLFLAENICGPNGNDWRNLDH
jgi:hypothetical protein